MNATEPFKQGDFSIICRTRARRFNAAQVRVKTPRPTKIIGKIWKLGAEYQNVEYPQKLRTDFNK